MVKFPDYLISCGQRRQVTALVLVALLQRAPVLRHIVSSSADSGVVMRAAATLKGVFAGVAALGTVQTVAGATTITPEPNTENNPASAQVGVPFEAAVAVTGAPAPTASYEIVGELPPGIMITGLEGDTVNAAALAITGTPTEAGSYSINVRAWRGVNKQFDGGSITFPYSIIVAPAPDAPPMITTQPIGLSRVAGMSARFSVEASGSPEPVYQWFKDGVAIAGAGHALFEISRLVESDAGDYSVRVTNAVGEVLSESVVLTVEPAPPGITVVSAPQSAVVDLGGDVEFSVSAAGPTELAYQWYHHRPGVAAPEAIDGATGPTLALSNARLADAGYYVARVAGEGDAVDSRAAVLAVGAGGSRLINLSTRGVLAMGESLTPGFVLRGTGGKSLVIRGIGPQLGVFGVAGSLNDTRLVLRPLGLDQILATNNDWGDDAQADGLREQSARLGAFPLNEGSADAAVLATIQANPSGNGYTVQIEATDSAAGGAALAEVYDTDGVEAPAQLVNLSVRGFSGAEGDALVPGFVIGGTGAKRVLIRAIGPSLAAFGVPGTMVDPRLEVIPLGKDIVIAENDDWAGASDLQDAFSTAGAFALSDSSSADAAIMLTLPPGGYTVRVSGAQEGTGVVLVEVYDLDS